MSANTGIKAKGGTGFIILSWLASLVGLPICFIAFVGWSMSSTSSPHANVGELLMLFAAPVVSAAALLFFGARYQVTAGRSAAMVVPALLTLLEFLFAVMVLRAG